MQQRPKATNLQVEYDKRARKMNSRLTDEVNRNVIVPGAIALKVRRPRNIYADEEQAGSPGPESIEISDGIEHVS